jgi:tetratricopeptide (TPR) repeat protein
VHPVPVVGVAFRPDGRAFVTVTAGGALRDWPLPAPLVGDPERLALAVQLSTGLRLDEGRTVVPLTRPEWEALRRRWAERAGSADWRIVPALPDADWHDARAGDAEQLESAFTARWHLERLARLRAGDWRVHARLGRAAALAGQWAQAEAHYQQAGQLGGREALQDWYRNGVEACEAGQHWDSQRWYLTQLLAGQTGDWSLYLRRALASARLGRGKECDADQERAVALGADRSALFSLADERAWQCGDWRGALALYAQTMPKGPVTLDLLRKFSLVCLKAGHLPQYRAIGELVLKEVRSPPPQMDARFKLVWLCVLGPDAVADYGPVVELAKAGLAPAPPREKLQRQLSLTTLGAAYCRAGRYKEAVAALEEALAMPTGKGVVEGEVFLALAHHHLGAHVEARRLLDKSLAYPLYVDSRRRWDNLQVELLRDEVQRVVRPAR